MNRVFTYLISCFVFLSLHSGKAWAQLSLSGTVSDAATKNTLAGVSIFVKGSTTGTTTDEHGRFKLAAKENPPFVLVISYVGYKTQEIEVNASMPAMKVEMEESLVLGQEVVIAASRTPEKILESPVSIERIGTAAIREIAAPSFYETIANLKGVETSAQSLTFRSINTRGFNTNGNVRFNQFVDGMDNQAPGLNFSIGNIVGLSELDVESVELLPGASSALYGAGGTNGTLLMASKNPFTFPGVSMMFKGGVNHLDDQNQGPKLFKELAMRVARTLNEKLAVKVNVSYLEAKDWGATDYSNYDGRK